MGDYVVVFEIVEKDVRWLCDLIFIEFECKWLEWV